MKPDFADAVKALSTEEILERIGNYDKWQPEFIEEARKEIQNRDGDHSNVESLIKERAVAISIEEEKGQRASRTVMGIVYLIAFYIFVAPNVYMVFIMPIVGIAICLTYFGKTKTSMGKTIYKYRQKDRSHFNYLIGIMAIAFIFRFAALANG